MWRFFVGTDEGNQMLPANEEVINLSIDLVTNFTESIPYPVYQPNTNFQGGKIFDSAKGGLLGALRAQGFTGKLTYHTSGVSRQMLSCEPLFDIDIQETMISEFIRVTTVKINAVQSMLTFLAELIALFDKQKFIENGVNTEIMLYPIVKPKEYLDLFQEAYRKSGFYILEQDPRSIYQVVLAAWK